MKNNKKIKVTMHWSFFILGVLMLLFGRLVPFLCCVLSVLLHEFGHAVVGRKLGYQLNLISLMPYGAILSGKNEIIKTKDEIAIAIAGPFVNVILLLMSFVALLIFKSATNWIYEFAIANIYTFCFNMLPIYPLDGGRILSGLVSKKVPKIKAIKITKTVGYVLTFFVFVLFFVSFFFKLNYMLGINALFLLIGLFEEDTSPYYEKIANIQNPRASFNFLKTIKLDKTTPIFIAYKKVVDKNISTIQIVDNHKTIATISSKKLMDSILTIPISESIEKLK